MKDCYKYDNGERWTYKRGWFNPRVTKSERGWKAQSKRRHQYKPIPA